MNDWIEWNGGECPVPDETIVDIRYRIDFIIKNVEARLLAFDHIEAPDDIIAYRIVEEQE